MKRKTKKRVTVLNTQVVRAINAIPVRAASQRDSMFRVLDILYRLANKENAVPGTYIQIPRNFWKKAVGEHYERTLNPLKDYGILQSIKSYSNFDGQSFCKSYRINPDLIDDKVECITYAVHIGKGYNQTKDNSVVAKYTKRILRSVKLNTRAIKKEVRSYVEQGKFIHKLQIDGDIFGSHGIIVDCTRIPYWVEDSITTSIEMAIEIANKWDRSLIKDKNRYIIDSLESYVNRKANQIIQAYSYSLAQLQHRAIYAKRNATNYRLDSNMTSFPTILLRHLSIDGEPLVSIDLANSQFTILANLIEQGQFKHGQSSDQLASVIYKLSSLGLLSIKAEALPYTPTQIFYQYTQNITIEQRAVTYMWAKSMIGTSEKDTECTDFSYENTAFSTDLVLFLELAKSGKIYDYIKDNLGLPTRAAAKTLAFEIFFSDYKYQGEAKRELSKIFPKLVRIIDDYKREHGSNQFAILLQKRESAIFIDRIMLRLIEKGYKVLSKHDSILCLESDLEGVEAEMRAVLDGELGQYELKITDAKGDIK